MAANRVKNILKEDEKDRVFAELSVAHHKKKIMKEFYLNILLSLTLVVSSFHAFTLMGKRVISSLAKCLRQ